MVQALYGPIIDGANIVAQGVMNAAVWLNAQTSGWIDYWHTKFVEGFQTAIDYLDGKVPSWVSGFLQAVRDFEASFLGVTCDELGTLSWCPSGGTVLDHWLDPVTTSITGLPAPIVTVIADITVNVDNTVNNYVAVPIDNAAGTAVAGMGNAAATAVGIPPEGYLPTRAAGVQATAAAKAAPAATAVGGFVNVVNAISPESCESYPGITVTLPAFGGAFSMTLFQGSGWFMSQFWCPYGRPWLALTVDVAVVFFGIFTAYGILKKGG